MINEFKKIAPAIVESVKVRVTADMTEQQIMMVIHEEIVSYFTKQQQMFVEYMTFWHPWRAVSKIWLILSTQHTLNVLVKQAL